MAPPGAAGPLRGVVGCTVGDLAVSRSILSTQRIDCPHSLDVDTELVNHSGRSLPRRSLPKRGLMKPSPTSSLTLSWPDYGPGRTPSLRTTSLAQSLIDQGSAHLHPAEDEVYAAGSLWWPCPAKSARRGELPAGTDPGTVLNLLTGPLW